MVKKINSEHGSRPVLVGLAAIEQREMNPGAAKEPIALMIHAVQQAALDAGVPACLRHVERIYVPKGLWPYTDPARLIAEAIGVNARTVLADFGILQQSLIGDACERIAVGEIHCALVVGGEAKFRQLQSQIQGVAVNDTQQAIHPDELMSPAAELTLDAETSAGLMMPVGFYALMESALRFSRGESVEANRDRLAALYSRMSEVAASNPHAWKREVVAAETIRSAVGKNRMLAFPYTKLHNSEWNVDQASALLLCSEVFADELGVAQAKRIYPLVSSESNHMVCLSQREQLHRAPGAALSLDAALAHAGLEKKSLKLLDLYSCFPAAVQIFADEAGVDTALRDITVTGGMPFAGGPLNNYVLQATCRMGELLREHTGGRCDGAISSVSGMMTKQAWGLWSNRPGKNGFAHLDVTQAAAEQSHVIPVLASYSGSATVRACTVLFQGDLPSRAIVIADTPDRQRVLAWSEDAAVMQAMTAQEWCGRRVTITPAGQFIPD